MAWKWLMKKNFITRPFAYNRHGRPQEDSPMQALLKFSRAVDWLNDRVGQLVYWLILLVVLISAGNAVMRKVFDMSSNAWLELQWYLFSAVFLLCAGFTLLRNEHVRIDVIAGRFSARTQAWIDIFGTVFFLLPLALMVTWLSWPYFVRGYLANEISGSAGGLTLWPARLLLPVGFALLTLQGLSELVKRVAFLAGKAPDPIKRHDHAAEAELAEEIRRMAEGKT
jgi:TRAP-type mannitol/chloroaromatic compound transport system permease small subunit